MTWRISGASWPLLVLYICYHKQLRGDQRLLPTRWAQQLCPCSLKRFHTIQYDFLFSGTP